MTDVVAPASEATASSRERAAVDPARLEVSPTAESHFSWLRTRMSMERTLMSWMRTATALIGFGFAIVQFFERVGAMSGARPALEPSLPRVFGFALIGLGTLSLALALAQYRALARHLWRPEFRPIAGIAEIRGPTPTPIAGVGLLLIGIWVLAALAFRLLG